MVLIENQFEEEAPPAEKEEGEDAAAEGEEDDAQPWTIIRKEHSLGFFHHQELILDLFPGIRSLASTAENRSPELLFSCMDWEQRLEENIHRAPAPPISPPSTIKKPPHRQPSSGVISPQKSHKGSLSVDSNAPSGKAMSPSESPRLTASVLAEQRLLLQAQDDLDRKRASTKKFNASSNKSFQCEIL